MTDQYTGRARITNKQTGATREGEAFLGTSRKEFGFREDGSSTLNFYRRADFTIEQALPEIPSEPGDTFTAEVTRNGETKRVVLMASEGGWWRSPESINTYDRHAIDRIDRATIESVITAKERGL